MSHIVDIRVKITDLNALAAAAKLMGGKLVRGKTQYQAYNQLGECDHCITFPSINHEVGIVKEGDHYTLQFDPYGSLGRHIGQKGERLMDEYNIQKASGEAILMGYAARELPVAADGTRTLEILVEGF